MQSTIGLIPTQGQGSSVRHHIQTDYDKPFFCIQSIRDYFPRFYPFKSQPELYLKIQSVPHSKHSFSVIKTDQFMLYSEIIAVCSEILTKHINTLVSGQHAELFNVKICGRKSEFRRIITVL